MRTLLVCLCLGSPALAETVHVTDQVDVLAAPLHGGGWLPHETISLGTLSATHIYHRDGAEPWEFVGGSCSGSPQDYVATYGEVTQTIEFLQWPCFRGNLQIYPGFTLYFVDENGNTDTEGALMHSDFVARITLEGPTDTWTNTVTMDLSSAFDHATTIENQNGSLSPGPRVFEQLEPGFGEGTGGYFVRWAPHVGDHLPWRMPSTFEGVAIQEVQLVGYLAIVPEPSSLLLGLMALCQVWHRRPRVRFGR